MIHIMHISHCQAHNKPTATATSAISSSVIVLLHGLIYLLSIEPVET